MLRLMLTLVLLVLALPHLYADGERGCPTSPAGSEMVTLVETEEAQSPVGEEEGAVEEVLSSVGEEKVATEEVLAMAEQEEGPVRCFWKSLLPDREFQPTAGTAYRITVSGSDREALTFSYQRLQPHPGEVWIAVHTQKTSDNRILVDGGNPGLFTAETGEFKLSLIVPAGWPLYLVEGTNDPYADPVVLSNIVKLP